MTVIDAGANLGVHSTFIARLVGDGGKVHAFEPSPKNFAKLSDAAKRYRQIICHPMALGSESREVSLYLSDALNVDHRLYAPPDENRAAVPIRCVALDDIIPSGSVVHFIKADVQGWELEAMRGAERIIRGSADLKLLCEFWPFGLKSAGSDPKAFIEYLQDAGFQIRKVGKSGGLTELRDADFRIDETVTCNIFATRDKLAG
ncbi:MAG TPA: FkbM family methyltransferase [Chthoniobacteraceae bacterium]|nr:FkbM family methyltransferase [Chthoniobacteraceae bacterium]